MINQLLKPALELLPENNRLERIWVLAKTDFLKRYYGSFLGLLWAMINPLTQLAIYYFVFSRVFENKQENLALFLFLGLVIYTFFAETTTFGLHIVQSKRYILENLQINWLDIYYAATLSTFFAFLFNFLTYFVASLFFDIEFHAHSSLFPLLMLNLLVFGFAVQLILSIVQIFIRDIVHVWDLTKMMILWLSGIFFEIDLSPDSKSAVLAYLTPLAGIAFNAKETLIYGKPLDWTLFTYDWIYTLFLLAVALAFYARMSRKALEKI